MNDSRKPFLTCYTPTYKRPKMLYVCKRSVKNQTIDTEQVIIPDEVGIGWKVFTEIRNHVDRCIGEYVLFLQDDCALIDDDVAEDIKSFAVDHEMPEVVIVKGSHGGQYLPDFWGTRPKLNHINLGNYIVRRDIWAETADLWQPIFAGDFEYIDDLWKLDRNRFEWFDRIVWYTQAIMHGHTEDEIDQARYRMPGI